MKNTITQLKALREIAPDEKYANESKAAIFAVKPHSQFFFLTKNPFVLRAALVATVVVVLFISASLYSGTSRPYLSSLSDSGIINNELDKLTINIHLKEISYHSTANQTIAFAIDEIIDGKARHMNTEILEVERSAIIEGVDQPISDIDKMLESVIF